MIPTDDVTKEEASMGNLMKEDKEKRMFVHALFSLSYGSGGAKSSMRN